jgi:hypothetical protein
MRAFPSGHGIPQMLGEVLHDLKLDLHSRKIDLPHHLVWCAGLPKSGTTRLEQLFRELPYVDASTSFLRNTRNRELHHDHDLSPRFVRSHSSHRYTFIRTHSHYVESTVELSLKLGAGLLVSCRDLRDMMISRYFHVIADKSHWQHNLIADLPREEGFLKSLTAIAEGETEVPIEYYYNWISDWDGVVRHDSRIHWVQYEAFERDPVSAIQEIVNHLGLQSIADSSNLADSIERTRLEAARTDLETRLYSRPRAKKSTFRKGGQGEWMDFMSTGLLDAFENRLPGPPDRVYASIAPRSIR